VRLLESALVRVPTVIGWLRPAILLPLGFATGLTTDQVAAVLAHELAHIRRHDYLINLLQVLVETLFFYHPAVWYISRRIRAERENCCDDMALGACPRATPPVAPPGPPRWSWRPRWPQPSSSSRAA
jgi:beta-lactamase regulating signal transducer with metallopeptidase domain